eukprot:m.438022 g.438022  ORF g.438022 m.438022 type:complete len:287 (+) comp20273_c1_seq64:171-1031(+)
MRVVTTVKDLRQAVREARRSTPASHTHQVGVVPTMGYLHRGHAALVAAAAETCDIVVVTIFVNPTQFGPDEDLGSYPRSPEADQRLCEQHGCRLVFCPPVEEVYDSDESVTVREQALSRFWCGTGRPVHFGGVTQVVTKLFNMVQPDAAFFGEKDFQQLAIVRRLVRDLHFDVTIVGVPLVRDDDGVALSSRNAYLTPAKREQARAISCGLKGAREHSASGERCVAKLIASARKETDKSPDLAIEYLAVVDAGTLEPITTLSGAPARMLVAGKIGKCRLIDNVALE